MIAQFCTLPECQCRESNSSKEPRDEKAAEAKAERGLTFRARPTKAAHHAQRLPVRANAASQMSRISGCCVRVGISFGGRIRRLGQAKTRREPTFMQ